MTATSWWPMCPASPILLRYSAVIDAPHIGHADALDLPRFVITGLPAISTRSKSNDPLVGSGTTLMAIVLPGLRTTKPDRRRGTLCSPRRGLGHRTVRDHRYAIGTDSR